MDVDIKGVLSLLKPDCIDCNLHMKRYYKIDCDDCNFIETSGKRKSEKEYFSLGIGLSANFNKYGIPSKRGYGKSQLYYFLYYPELKFEYPTGDVIDMFGNPKKYRKGMWLIHHMNKKNWDDNIWNILLCLRNEHGYFENMNSNNIFYSNIKKLYNQIGIPTKGK